MVEQNIEPGMCAFFIVSPAAVFQNTTTCGVRDYEYQQILKVSRRISGFLQPKSLRATRDGLAWLLSIMSLRSLTHRTKP